MLELYGEDVREVSDFSADLQIIVEKGLEDFSSPDPSDDRLALKAPGLEPPFENFEPPDFRSPRSARGALD